MKYFKDIQWSCVIIIIIAISIPLGIYVSTKGNLYYKYILKKEVNEYLKEKYNEEVYVTNIEYDWKRSDSSNDLRYYYIGAEPKNNANLHFEVFPMYNEKINVNWKNIGKIKFYFRDAYIVSKWQMEARNKIINYSKKVYKNVDVSLSANGYAFNKQEEIENFEGRSLTFREIRDIIDGGSHINIIVKRNFNNKEEYAEYNEIFKLIDYLKKEGFNPISLYIEFSNKRISLSEDTEDFQQVNSPNDIKKFIDDNEPIK